MMLWLVILLPTMAAKCMWMPFGVKEDREAVERQILRDVWHLSRVFFSFPPYLSAPHSHCEIQI